jgi:DNA transformation protein
MGELSELPNIGKEIERQLNEAHITTYEQLKEIGSKQAWLKIRENDPSACVNRLYGLEGAIRKIRKSELSPEIKAELKEYYHTFR